MSNPLRAVYDNSANRSTLSVTGTPAMPVANLLTNSKSEVWRTASAVLSATLTLTYASAEVVGCVSLPFCNFSASATMRVRLYSDTGCTVLLRDSGTLLCSQCAGGRVASLTAVQSASAYAYGGGTDATVWMIKTSGVLGIKIDLADSSNLQGYLEAARLVVGDYFSPQYNAELGASVTYSDTTNNYRTDAGNLLSDMGTRNKLLSITLSFLTPTDRANIWDLVKYCGRQVPVLISLYPENVDKKLESAHTVYGKFSGMTALGAVNYNVYTVPLELEGV